jgi:hypothetical protein
MTSPDELESAVERLEAVLSSEWFLGEGADSALGFVSFADLRLILSANREMREALEQSTITLRMLKRNVETEIKRHDGLFRWEGVPEAIQVRIDQAEAARSALTTQRGDGE